MKNEQLRTDTISKAVEMIKKLNELLPKNYLFVMNWTEFPKFIDVYCSVFRDDILIENSVAFEDRTFYECTTSDDLDKDFENMLHAIIQRVNDDIEKEGEQ